ncbi:hypothetical protein GKE82_21045 [Conexibacter sp. W3-3-2]|uniref:hypothetical protein n=1 Tax=Conexibacter sp. W3-3-2 TaxID=2675227 RepID=UPI0012B8AEA5|nr:hypothetical protein [Conexibacter sp. W3-3-2]MTD46708.1 hypothetical protein [Conexibacter sp. W3-3-2]
MTTINTKGAITAPVNEPENERVAHELINRAIKQAGPDGTIGPATARLIAATIHRGETTALGRFAATGVLNPLEASVELWDGSINELPPAWWRALDMYLDQESGDGAR